MAIAPVNSDTLFGILKAQGIRFTPGSDAELNILADMPFTIADAIPSATLTTAISSLSAGDQTKLTTQMTKRKGTK